MGDLTKNFNRADFQCHCAACASDPTRPISKQEAIDALQALRDCYGEPIIVVRGVSCAAHNAAIGGAGDSRHLPEHADAFDLRVDGSDKTYTLIKWALIGGRFSFYELAPGHLHVDMRPGPYRFIVGSDH